MSIEVIPGANEPIRLSLSDSSSGWLTGQTVRASVVNIAAGTVWNWGAAAFQSYAAAGAAKWQALAAVDAANEPGVYQGATAFPVPAGSGAYEVRYERDPGGGYVAIGSLEMRAGLASSIPTVAAIAAAAAAAVWAIADGVSTMGASLSRIRKWTTWSSAQPNKKTLSLDGLHVVVTDDDGTTTIANVPVAALGGAAVAPAAGESVTIG